MGLREAARHTEVQHLRHGPRVGLITDLEHILARHALEAREGGLQVIQRVTHVALSSEDDRLQTVVLRRHPLLRRAVTKVQGSRFKGDARVRARRNVRGRGRPVRRSRCGTAHRPTAPPPRPTSPTTSPTRGMGSWGACGVVWFGSLLKFTKVSSSITVSQTCCSLSRISASSSFE